ncbi:polysaccharide deacetylase family protein [Candidatus Methylospira mobilis]|uniref:Polysaccharide deacetylase family protein n=1 Tax=Candidatus Methylospira mobilis TaxID=1808979 RepID=A0A5Q0BHI3_9GAMM|nr:polysaccharide deacetylase family protein [Candidatus Methylospira mobilis]QFY41588.1 polysaccharide deacetylase family protein [Candidatus Methylospira mobilis]WNV05170.1 polysaccharide deacetylase family protein [Candidatus Methylospira mobilis]
MALISEPTRYPAFQQSRSSLISVFIAVLAATCQNPAFGGVVEPENRAVDRPPVAREVLQTRPDPIDTTSLLSLWGAEDLRGHPGEERITYLHKPDFAPPASLEATQLLPQLDERQMDSIRRVRLPSGKNLVALTFDLCEQADDITGYDRGIVNYLRDNHIPATFFAGGKWMRSHPQRAMQLMADPGFEVGNHGWTHGNLRRLSGQRMMDQVVWAQAEYEQLWDDLALKAKNAGLEALMNRIPRLPVTLRFPYGTCSAESLRAVNQLGLGAIQWDVVSGDADPHIPTAALIRGVINNVRAGSIVVFHANGRGHGTAAALPGIVAALRAKGFAFTTVSKLLQEGVPETVKDCFELRPGDNAYIDAKFGDGTQ